MPLMLIPYLLVALSAALIGGSAAYIVGEKVGHSSGVLEGRKLEHAAQLEADKDASGKARTIRDRIARCELELGGVWDESRKSCSKPE